MLFLLGLETIEVLSGPIRQLSPFLSTSGLGELDNGKDVGSIDKYLVDLLDTQSGGLGVEEVDRRDDANGDSGPNEVELPVERVEPDWSCD